MTTKNLHFKWTVSRGRDTYGYNICTLLVDGERVGKTCGGGYDMKGTVLAQWLQNNYQQELITLFSKELDALRFNDSANYYKNSKGLETKYSYDTPYYGARLQITAPGRPDYDYLVTLDGACGFSSIESIAEAIGITLKWNPESNRYKNHIYYTALINPIA